MASSLRFLSALIIFTMPVVLSSELNEVFCPGFKDLSTNLTLQGAAKIEKNGVLRLTNFTNDSHGEAFYALPFQFKNSTNGKVFSFSTSFAVAIVSQFPKVVGDSLAFTISTSKDLQGLPGLDPSDVQNFSINLFAVMFDINIYSDDFNSVYIDNLISDASSAKIYSTDGNSTGNFRLKREKAFQTWIDYDSAEKIVNVSLSLNSSKPLLPIMSFPLDLSPIFHGFVYVGFSSSRGHRGACSNYILGWSFKLNGPSRALHLSSLPSLQGAKKKHSSLIIGVSTASVALAVCGFSVAIFYLIKRIKSSDIIEDWERDIGPKRYSYRELKQATNNFSDKELLGQGGFGQVYKGTLPNSKTDVAVKRISDKSRQGVREFVSEIASIGKLRHRNLVQLMGWCGQKGHLLLVYDFMPNGSLDNYLFDKAKRVLNWEQRFKIIKGVASALLYLHEEYDQVVIHRDVKASNILLDNELNGRLGDFGLARLHEHGSDPGTTRVAGTLGYLAPELPRTGKATASSDVYAFGALLLEVASGRRPVEHKAAPEEVILVDLVWDRFSEGRVLDVVDFKLDGEYQENEVVMVIKLGIWCSNMTPKQRPSMRQIVGCLEGEIELPEIIPGPYAIDAENSLVDGFDDLFNSSVSSSNDKMIYSLVENDAICASTSPLSLLHGRGQTW